MTVLWEGTLLDVDDTTVQVRVTRDGDTVDALEYDDQGSKWVSLMDEGLRLDAYEMALRAVTIPV